MENTLHRLNPFAGTIHFVNYDEKDGLEPSRVVGFVAAFFHIFLFSFPLRQIYLALQIYSPEFYAQKAATLASAGLAAVVPWAFLAGMAARIELAKGKRLPASIANHGESILITLMRLVVQSAISPIVVVSPVILGLCLIQFELTVALSLLLLTPSFLFMWTAAGLGLSLLIWPEKITVKTSQLLRLVEAMGVCWLVILFRMFGPEQVFSSRGLEALQGLGATLVTITPLFHASKAAISGLLGGPIGYGVLLLPLCCLFFMALFADGAKKFASHTDRPVPNCLTFCKRGEGHAAILLTIVLWLVLAHLALTSRLGDNYRTILVWSVVIGGLSYYFVGRWSLFTARDSLLNNIMYPQNMTTGSFFKQCSRSIAGGLTLSALFLGVGVLRGWYNTATYIVALAAMLVSFIVVTVVVKLPWSEERRATDNPGGRIPIQQKFSLSQLLACETAFVFISGLAGSGTYVFLRYEAPFAITVSWSIISFLTLAGTLFFGAVIPVLFWFGKRKSVDRPFASH